MENNGLRYDAMKGNQGMKHVTLMALTTFVMLSLIFAGCASADGGQVAAGILQGIDQGLSGL